MEIVSLDVVRREKSGSAECRRLRRDGRLPAILYGLGRESTNLSCEAHSFESFFRRGRRMFELKLGDKTQISLLKDVAFNALGNEVVHLDFVRVDDKKPVTVSVAIVFYGTPIPTPGAVVEYVNRDIKISCLPRQIPESIEVRVGELKVGHHIEAGQVKLPEGVMLAENAHRTLVSYHYKAVELAPVATEGPAEPVVLTERKPVEGEAAPDAKAKDKEKK